MAPYLPNHTYHIFNRANGDERLFREPENYRFFMKKYGQYLNPVADTFAYCLMPNHFHLLLRFQSSEKLARLNTQDKETSQFLAHTVSNFLNSYCKSFNKLYHRRGSLLMRHSKRQPVSDESYFLKLIHYIHCNPVAGGLAERPADWRFSSYPALVGAKPTSLLREEVLERFGGLENFKYCHLAPPKISGVE